MGIVNQVMARLGCHASSERGATAVEYALMVTLIAIVIIGGVTLLGGNLGAFFTDVGDTFGGF